MAKYKDNTTGEVIEVGSPELNPNLIAGKIKVPDNTPLGVINSSTLTPSTSIDFNTTSTPSVPDVSKLDTSVLTLTPQEKKADDLSTQLQDLQNRFLGQSAFRVEKEKELDVEGLRKTQTDLSARLKAIQNEAQAIPLQLQTEATGRGITAGGLAPLQTERLRANAIQALSTSSLLEASRGNLTTALDMVDRAVAAKYDPIKEERDVKLANLEIILKSPSYTLADKNRAEAQKAKIEAQKKIDDKKELEEKEIGKIAVDAAQKGVDALTLKKIQEAKTSQEALNLAAPFLKEKEKPTFQTFERVGADSKIHNIRQAIDAKGNVIKETDLGTKEKTTSKIDDKIDKGETIDATNILENPNLSSSEKNNLTLQSILTSSKVSATNKTQIGYVLGVVEAAKSLAELNPAGSFTGVSPFTSILNVKIPWTKIGLPFRNALKREQTVKNETFINGIILQTGYWASGATLTAQQLELVDKMTPNMSDTDKNVQTKINTLTNFMLDQTKAKLQAEGINFKPQKVDLFETNNLLNKASEEQLKVLQKEGLL